MNTAKIAGLNKDYEYSNRRMDRIEANLERMSQTITTHLIEFESRVGNIAEKKTEAKLNAIANKIALRIIIGLAIILVPFLLKEYELGQKVISLLGK